MLLLSAVALSVPFILAIAGGFLVTSLVRQIVHARRDIIRNKRIGAYRIKADPNDPNVIEVSDA